MAAPNGWRDKIRRAFKNRDEGDLENVLENLPENAELHLHMAPKDNGEEEAMDNMAGVVPAAMDSRLKAHDAELEELWRAIDNPSRRARDAYLTARDARRKRMGIHDADKEDDDDKNKNNDRRLARDDGKEDDDDDDKKKNNDEFSEPPPAGGVENTVVVPGFEIEAPPGTADRFKKARDSAFMGDSFQQTCAYAEVLVPGIRMPTFDGAAPPKQTFDALCGFRAKVIDLAWNSPASRDLIDDISGGRFTDVKEMNCQQVRDLFVAAGAARARENDLGRQRNGIPQVADGASYPVGTASLGTMQQSLNEFYAARK